MNFIHPGFLIAGAAAATLPIIIHLMMRQRATLMPIGSVKFLKDVLRQHTRRRRIKQWLLMAMRIVAVLLLAMLFARPFLDRSHLQGSNREFILLLDRSASMQIDRGDGETALEAGQKFAIQELAKLEPNTAIRVAVFDAAGVEEIAVDRLSDSLSTRLTSTDFGAALSWASDIMTVSGRENRQVVMITDLQRSGLQQTAFNRFAGGVDFVLHDVGRTITQNIAIESCRDSSTEIRPDEDVRVTTRLFNAGALPLKDLQVLIQLDGPQGRITDKKTTTLRGSERKTLEFKVDIKEAGLYSGFVEIHVEDELDFDNRRWIAFEARHPDRILLVDGQQGRSVYTNETYFLETALRLRLKGITRRSFEIERIVWEDGKGLPDLTGFKTILMCNVLRWSNEDVTRLKNYVHDGGHLIVSCGDQTRVSHLEMLKEAGLLNIEIERQPMAGPFRIKSWDSDHPILTPFEDAQQGDLRRISYNKVVNLASVGTNVKTLITAGEAPLLLEQPYGSGSTLLFTSTVDRDWTQWPQTRLYVPMVRQLVAYAVQQLEARQLVQTENINDINQEPGITQSESLMVVRNIDVRESRLERVTEAEFRAAYGIASLDADRSRLSFAESVPPPQGSERPDEAWTYVVLGLFVLLIVEMFLASRVHT